jgi:hypothetical protein
LDRETAGMMDARSSRVLSVATVGGALALAAACGGGEKMSGVASAKLPEGARSETLDHEACNESGNRVEVLDTNGDGKPDIRRVFDASGHEKCRIADLNHDGKADLYEYFDSSGAIRRRELCYDDTGVVNAIEIYDGGSLSMREFDTSGQHRIDTWEWFDSTTPPDPKTGRPAHPARRERDTTGHGMVDQWWTWEGSKVSIATDHDGDGKPDPASLIVLGGGSGGDGAGAPGSSAPASAAASGAIDAGASDAGPTRPAASATAASTPAASAGATADGGKP